MKTFRIVPFVLALAACGGGLTNEDFRANAPTFDKFAVAQNDGDTAAPTAETAAPTAGTDG